MELALSQTFLAMHTLLRAILIARLLPLAACSTVVTVDDSDPGIKYVGLWTSIPVSGTEDLDYEGTLTGTNINGATASFNFHGGEHLHERRQLSLRILSHGQRHK